MNRFYRHIWSRPLGQVVAIPECARGGAGRKAGRRRGTSLIALALMLAAVPAGGAIADTTWTGAVDSDWNNASNWTNGVPANTGAYSDINGPVTAVVDTPGAATEDRTRVGYGSGVSGFVRIENGGSLTAGCCFYLGANRGTGTMTVTGANSTFTTPNIFMVGDYYSTGYLFIEDGGTVNSYGGGTFVGRYDDSYGYVTVTGENSLWSVSGSSFRIAGETTGSQTAYGSVTLSDSGLLRVFNGNGSVVVGNAADSTAFLNIGAAEGDAALAPGEVEAGSIVLGNGDGSLVFNHIDAGYTFSTPVSGNGEVRQIAGTTILAGTNTYSGSTVVEGGILRAGVAGGFSGNSLYEVNGGTLDLNDFDLTMPSLSGTGGTVDLGSAALSVGSGNLDSTFAGVIEGSGRLEKTGTGKLTLAGANSYSGGTTISGGTLEGTTSSLVGDIVNNALLVFNQAFDGIFGGDISGTGSLEKSGSGVVTLSGTNSYSGGTTVEEGTLRAGSATGFVAGGAYTVNGGTLDLNDFDLAMSALSGTGGTVDLGSAELTVGSGNLDSTFAGVIEGTGRLEKTGTGKLTLAGANSYSGGTTISGGTLEGTTSSLVGDIVNNALLVFNQAFDGIFGGDISGTGSLEKSGSGVVTLTGTNSYTGGTTVEEGTLRAGSATGFAAGGAYTVNGGTLDLNDFDLTMPSLSGTGGTVDLGSAELTVDQDDDTSFSGAITGSGSFVKLGQGVLSVLGINTYSGSTEVAEGTLEVSGGGALAGASGAIGGGLGETGEVTISGVGSVWNISGEIHIGDAGTGTLGVAAGGVVSATNGYIANQAGSSGDVTVDGAGSELNLSGNLAVGNSGDATLAVSDGGAVSNIDGLIGYFAAGNSAVTVDGEDSAWTNSGELTIGVWGGATLDITDGGAVSNTIGYIGRHATGDGEVEVTGADSTWTNSGSLFVGDAGAGSLIIGAGGTVSNTSATVGNQAGSDGDVTVDGTGAVWTNTGDLVIGATGSGTLDILGGGAVSNASGFIGDLAAGTGSVTVDGADSTWTNTGGNGLNVGWSGSATLDISNGGAVSSLAGHVGRQTGSTGTVTVSGADSIWSIVGALLVGNSGSGTLTLSDGGAAEAASVTIASNASSTGTLNIGAASGDAAAAAGTLDAASIVFGAGDGTLVFNHTDNGYIFGAAISGAGEVLVENGETVFTGAATHTGGTTISGGTLQIGNGGTAGSVAGDIANDGMLIIDRSDAYTYAGDLSGAGDIRLLGAGTTRLTGSSSGFTGSFFVEAGMLIVDDIIGGTLNVAGARLGGGGNLENLTIGNGGILAPGNSVGSMIAYGDAAFGDGALFEVEVNDGTSLAFVDRPGVNNDFLDVRGSLTIDSGAAVHVTPENGTDDGSTYTPGLIYTILTASGGVTGTFGSVTTDFAFLAPELTYGPNDVFLELVHNNADFSEVAVTPNQQGVSNTVQQFGPGHPLYDEIIMMTDEEARAAYDALSGESHSSASTTQFMTAAEIRQQLLNRISALFGSGGGGLAGLAGAPAAGDAAPGTASIWGQLFGGWGESDADAAAAAVDRRIHGFIGGADREIAPGISAGLALGYSRTSYSVAARASSGDSDNFHIAGYAGTELGDVDLRGILSYGYGRSDTQRTAVVGGVVNNLSASYGTHTFQAAVEAAVGFDAGPVTLTPFAGLAGVHVETESFTETGGPAALSFASSGNTTGISTLGLRVGREAGQVALTGAAAWRHAFGDVEPASRAAFASAPASTFAVRGAPVSEDALVLDAGVTARLDTSTTLTIGYSGEYASGARDHGLRAELRIEF